MNRKHKKQSKRFKSALRKRFILKRNQDLLFKDSRDNANSTKEKFDRQQSLENEVVDQFKVVKKIKKICKQKKTNKKRLKIRKNNEIKKRKIQSYKKSSVIVISSQDQQDSQFKQQKKYFLNFKVKIKQFQQEKEEKSPCQNRSQSQQQLQYRQDCIIKKILKIYLINQEKIFEVELFTGQKTNITRNNLLKFFPQTLALYYESQAIIY